MNLTTGQRAALTLLAKRRCYTSNATHGEMNVQGRAAQSLVRRGLARFVRGWFVSGNRRSMTIVEITDAGRAALGNPTRPAAGVVKEHG